VSKGYKLHLTSLFWIKVNRSGRVRNLICGVIRRGLSPTVDEGGGARGGGVPEVVDVVSTGEPAPAGMTESSEGGGGGGNDVEDVDSRDSKIHC